MFVIIIMYMYEILESLRDGTRKGFYSDIVDMKVRAFIT